MISPRIAVVCIVSLALLACKPPGKDQFQTWQAKGANRKTSIALQDYLNQQGVGDVIAMHQLLRSDVKWKRCSAQPFSIPAPELWPNMVPTLKVLRYEVLPLIGKVEALSVFRDRQINRCIKGARRSFHMRFQAMDLKPVRPLTRQQLINRLCRFHRTKGRDLNMGLGIYSGTRFHIDTAGYRGWGHDHRAATFPCSDVAPQRKSR